MVLHHPVSESVRVGALGTVQWSEGWFYYVGCARRGWTVRLKRFQPSLRKRFWHVDYLYDRSAARLTHVGLILAPRSWECRVARAVGQLADSRPLITGFGASDCEEGCTAHGWVAKEAPEASFVQLSDLDVPLAGWVRFKEDRCRWHPL